MQITDLKYGEPVERWRDRRSNEVVCDADILSVPAPAPVQPYKPQNGPNDYVGNTKAKEAYSVCTFVVAICFESDAVLGTRVPETAFQSVENILGHVSEYRPLSVRHKLRKECVQVLALAGCEQPQLVAETRIARAVAGHGNGNELSGHSGRVWL